MCWLYGQSHISPTILPLFIWNCWRRMPYLKCYQPCVWFCCDFMIPWWLSQIRFILRWFFRHTFTFNQTWESIDRPQSLYWIGLDQEWMRMRRYFTNICISLLIYQYCSISWLCRKQQAHKARRCDSYLQIWNYQSLTHPPTDREGKVLGDAITSKKKVKAQGLL